jgi:quinohemoprotein ethanol dehydrogenase
MGRLARWIGAFGALLCTGLGTAGLALSIPTTPPASVDQRRLEAADKEPGQWMSVGRTWSEQRFSPLKQINDKTVGRLGLAWYADLNTYRGVLATPLVIDGVLYNVSAWDIVTAYDATNGKPLWTYDPKVPVSWARLTCCGPVSRGLAAWHGKIYLAALDGRLIALDARSGEPVWTARTLDGDQPLSVTGAPRIADGQVVIGNSGGDLGARGYISAFDAETGKQTWKFYIVPGDPSKRDGAASDPVMPMAAKTWRGEWWKQGGGGNDWDAIAYDPKLHLVYFGTGNGSPHLQKFRSPGGGDNLFLCSVVAVDARTGHYRWHYQEIPGEEWDYDCTAPMILADLKIAGRVRPVLMHAPKDGFFYVIDRATGKLISAKAYVDNNTWASRIDLKTGRPVLSADARPTETPHLLSPGAGGGHNWNPMSFSPLTGLVYIPAQETYSVESALPDGQFKFVKGQSTLGYGFRNDPELRKSLNAQAASREKGYLVAWDPVHQKQAFRIPYPHAGSGGTMVTAGNLLIQSTIRKTLAIYRADTGQKLWEMPIESVQVGGAATYMVGGRQYLAVNAGWNSAVVQGLDEGGVPFTFAPARLLVFALDAKGVTLPPAPPSTSIPQPPTEAQPEEKVAKGAGLYAANCAICHGQNAAGGVKDLRHMTDETHAAFADIVLGGKLKANGMEPFADKLSAEDAGAIHAYLISRAQEDWQPDYMHPKRK